MPVARAASSAQAEPGEQRLAAGHVLGVQLLGQVVGAHHQHGQPLGGARRSPRRASIATGVSTIAQSGVCSGAPAGLQRARPARARRRREFTLGRRSRPGPACAGGRAGRRRATRCRAPLTRIVSSRAPYSPRRRGGARGSRAAALASGATASSRSRISASHGDRLGLLQRPLVGRRACRAPSGAAGTSSLTSSTSDDVVQLRRARGRARRAARRARP